MIRSPKTGALILSGGKSQRMGRDKTTAEFGGETFLARAVRFWKSVPQVSKIYLGIGSEAHRRELEEDPGTAELFRDAVIEAVTDLYPQCGPMAGIHAAFSAGDEAYLYVCAVDMLKMDSSALPFVTDAEKDAFVYREGDNIEPLFALYSRRVLKPAEKLLSAGKYKMQMLLDNVNTEYLPVTEKVKSAFYNCNTPEDLRLLRQGKRSGSEPG